MLTALLISDAGWETIGSIAIALIVWGAICSDDVIRAIKAWKGK